MKPSPFGRIVLGLFALAALLAVTGVSTVPVFTTPVFMVVILTLGLWLLECRVEKDGSPGERLRSWLIWPAFAILSEAALQVVARLTPRVVDAQLAYYDSLLLLRGIDSVLALVRGPILTLWWEVGYQSMFVTPLVLWWAARKQPKARRTFLRAFLLIGGIGLCGYLLMPAVGPRFYSPEWYEEDLYGAEFTPAELETRAAKSRADRLEPNYPRLAHRNCFPSLHTAWGVLYLLMAFRLGRRWFWLVAPFALTQIGATMVLRWHYVIDLLVGAPLAYACWAVMRRLEDRDFWPARRAVEPVGHMPQASRLMGVCALSGAAALLYEIAAARSLTNVFGGMADAVATVLATYMAGLSLGAFIGGRLADRIKNPVRFYAIAEGVIALTVLALPFGVDLALDAYVAAVRGGLGEAGAMALRVTLSAVLLLPPTLAMGATLPLLVAHWMRVDPEAHRAVPRLYGANTLGAAVGVLMGTYLLLPILGIFKTLLFVALADLTAAMIALKLAREPTEAMPVQPSEQGPTVADSTDMVKRPRLLLLAVFVGSFVLFALEVQWTHVLAVVVGNSAYAFGVMLFCVLVGLAWGGRSAESVPTVKRAATLVRDAALFSVVVGASLFLWDGIPAVFNVLGLSVATFLGRETVRFLVCFFMLVPPCFLSGRIYALAMAAYAGGAGGVGRRVGRLSAASTVGAIAGSLAGSFVVLPQLGSQMGLRVLATGLLLSAALYAAAVVLAPSARRVTLAVGAATVLLVALFPGWDINRLTDGSNVYFRAQWLSGKTVYVHEDKYGGLTTVREENGVFTLLTNGKFQGNDRYEMADQQAFALYPILHLRNENFNNALVIGLGTGVSAATVHDFPFTRLVVCEISPGIIEAAGRYFGHVNDEIIPALGDDLLLRDGRHHLLITDDRYDLISMEISSIWFAGASALYNREFYALADERLAPGGVFQQWVQLHHLLSIDLASVLASIRAVFPHVHLFVGGHQGVLVASQQPLDVSAPKLAAWCADPRFHDACARFEGDLRPYLARRLLDTAGIDRFIAHVAKRAGMLPEELESTDDSLYLEYATPRGNVLPIDSGERMLERLREFRE